ncbi:MAG: hypothetical protein ACREC0_13635 [Methylocella sp.]
MDPSLYPATDGLRNLTGKVNHDGTVALFAITSTISNSGDQGADPNRLVSISDDLEATSLPPKEHFNVLETAGFAQVLRGVAFTPCRDEEEHRWNQEDDSRCLDQH